MPGHIIHNQVFHIAVDAEEEANNTGETVKSTYYGKVLPVLDEMFSRLSPDDKVYRFNRLEIDLGYLSGDQLEMEMPGVLTRLVEEALSEKIEQAGFMPPDETSMKVVPVSTSLFEAFLFYLEKGFLPWWLSVSDGKQPGEIFRELPASIDPAFVPKLKRVLQQKKARTRLALQFSEAFVYELLQKASIDFTTDAESGGEESPALLPALLIDLLGILEKLEVPEEIREAFRVNLIRELAGKDTAYAHFPPDFDPKKTKQSLVDFIRSSVEILIKTLAVKGFKADEILKILKQIESLVSEKSLTRYGFRGAEFKTKEIETIVAKYRKEKTDKEAEGIKKEIVDDEAGDEDTETGIYIRNAGVVLLWPFLKNYFTSLELLADDRFKSRDEQHKAVVLLQYAVTGKEIFAEHQLPLNKILCGLPVDEPVDTELRISAKEKKETEALIRSAIEQWKAIGKVSVEGFRESFLKREGRLRRVEGGWSLKVERKTHDILLDKIPWMISMVRLKWMKKMVFVDW